MNDSSNSSSKNATAIPAFEIFADVGKDGAKATLGFSFKDNKYSLVINGKKTTSINRTTILEKLAKHRETGGRPKETIVVPGIILASSDFIDDRKYDSRLMQVVLTFDKGKYTPTGFRTCEEYLDAQGNVLPYDQWEWSHTKSADYTMKRIFSGKERAFLPWPLDKQDRDLFEKAVIEAKFKRVALTNVLLPPSPTHTALAAWKKIKRALRRDYTSIFLGYLQKVVGI